MPPDPAQPSSATPAEVARALRADDLAEHHQIVDPGPDQVTRAVVGLLLGAAVGAAASLLTSRRGA